MERLAKASIRRLFIFLILGPDKPPDMKEYLFNT